jgi:hypothetical protein
MNLVYRYCTVMCKFINKRTQKEVAELEERIRTETRSVRGRDFSLCHDIQSGSEVHSSSLL